MTLSFTDIPKAMKARLVRIGHYSDRPNAEVYEFDNNVNVYFSYETIVAFAVPEGIKFVHKNDWGPTTGKHINLIDGGGKAKEYRLPDEEFTRLFLEMCQVYSEDEDLLFSEESDATPL